MWAIMETAFDLVSVFVDFLVVSSVSVSVLQFGGIILVTFLLGLLLGRVTRRGIQKAVEYSHKREGGRVFLEFEKSIPLGPSKEEEAENSAMQISDLTRCVRNLRGVPT